MEMYLNVYVVNNKGKKEKVNNIHCNNPEKIYKELLGVYRRKVEKTNKVRISKLPYENTIKATIVFEREQTGGLAKTIYEYEFLDVEE